MKKILLIISLLFIIQPVHAEVKKATLINVLTGVKRVVECKPGQYRPFEVLWNKDLGARTDSVWRNYANNYYFNANVGIGTTSPTAQLQVNNSTKAATTTVAVGSSWNTKQGKICVWNTTNWSIISFSANSATVSVATSTTCQ